MKVFLRNKIEVLVRFEIGDVVYNKKEVLVKIENGENDFKCYKVSEIKFTSNYNPLYSLTNDNRVFYPSVDLISRDQLNRLVRDKLKEYEKHMLENIEVEL